MFCFADFSRRRKSRSGCLRRSWPMIWNTSPICTRARRWSVACLTRWASDDLHLYVDIHWPWHWPSPCSWPWPLMLISFCFASWLNSNDFFFTVNSNLIPKCCFTKIRSSFSVQINPVFKPIYPMKAVTNDTHGQMFYFNISINRFRHFPALSPALTVTVILL